MAGFARQILLTMILLPAFFVQGRAQLTQDCVSPTDICSRGEIEVCAPDPATNSNTCPLIACYDVPQRCRQQRFQVYLRGGFDGCLDYNLFEVGIQVSATAPAGRQPLSAVNAKDTESCNSGVAGPPLAPLVRVSNNMVSLSAGSLNGIPPVTLYSSTASTLLFIIVVDVWPGETVNVKCTSALYGWDAGGDGDMVCPLAFNPMGVSATAPVPPSDPTLSVGFALPLIGGPNNLYKDIPFDVNNFATGTTNVEELEISFKVVPDNKDFVMPTIINGGSGLNYTVSSPTSILNPLTGLQEWHYVCTLNGNIVNGASTLFYLRVFRPIVFKKCGTACPVINSVRVIRAIKGETTCLTPGIVSLFGTCADFGLCLPDCSQNISIKATGTDLSSNTPGTCGFRIRLNFDWPENNAFYELTKLKIVFEFAGGGNFTINSTSGNAINCPTNNNNPTMCGACSTISGNLVTYCFSKGIGPEFLILRKKDNNGQTAYTDIVFTANIGAVVSEVRLLESEFQLKDALGACVPGALTQQGFPVGPPYISGRIVNNTQGVGVTQTSVSINCPSTPTVTDNQGNYAICVCNYGSYAVTPTRLDNVLNGVDETDLYYIQQHILNAQPFGHPYTMIAADANQSGTITTLDIVNLRRHILNVPPLPNIPSWRFVPSNYVFPNTNNPFIPSFPSTANVVVSNGSNATGVNFTGMKAGDVVPVFHIPKQQPLPLQIGTIQAKAGDIFSIPLRSGCEEPLALVQAAFQFDPELLEFVGHTIGEVKGITPDCFGLTQRSSGIIRFLWLAVHPTEEALWPGRVLCHLQFRAKRHITTAQTLLHFAIHDLLEPKGITSKGKSSYLLLENETETTERSGNNFLPAISIYCTPNPTTGPVVLVTEAMRKVPEARLLILDAFRRQVFYRGYSLMEGVNELSIEGSDGWPSGLYSWVMLSEGKRLSEGRFIKTK